MWAKEFPFGFCLQDEQTVGGPMPAFRFFEIMQGGLYQRVIGVLEKLWTSKIKFQPGHDVVAYDDHCRVVTVIMRLWVRSSLVVYVSRAIGLVWRPFPTM